MKKVVDLTELFHLTESIVGYSHQNANPVPLNWITEMINKYFDETRGERVRIKNKEVEHCLSRLDISIERKDDSVLCYISASAAYRLYGINSVMTTESLVPFVQANPLVQEVIRKEKIFLLEGVPEYETPSQILSDGSYCRVFRFEGKDLVLRWEIQPAKFFFITGIEIINDSAVDLLVVREANTENNIEEKGIGIYKKLRLFIKKIVQCQIKKLASR